MKVIAPLYPLFAAALLAACDQPATEEPLVQDNTQVENRGAGKDNWWDALPRSEWSKYTKVEQSEDWFEVYQINESLFAIYEPGQFEEVISFLILGEDRALLFDSGLGIGNMRAVVGQLTDLDVVVLNSHSHYDHIGGNYQFDYIFGRDTAFTRSREAGSSTADVAEFLSPGWIWKELPAEFDAVSFRSQPYAISERVDEGFTIDLGGRELEVLVTPGHAPDALCLIDRAGRMLFSGDTFYLAPLYTHLDGSDFEQYRQSAARLAELAEDVDQVMTAHNVPVVESEYLTRMNNAFASILEGSTDYVLTDGSREYDFNDFSIIVRDDVFP